MGDFEIEAVLYFMLSKGGRVRNHELVTHFKNFLNHPNNKVQNRDKFKDFVNELATIKLDGGEKVLVLKKKYRPVSEGGGGLALPPKYGGGGVTPRQAGGGVKTKWEDGGATAESCDSPRAHSEPPIPENKQPVPMKRQTSREDRGWVSVDSGAGGRIPKTKSQQEMGGAPSSTRNQSQPHHGEDAISTASSSLSLASTTSQESATSATSGFSSLDGDSQSSAASVVDVQMRRSMPKADDNVSVNSNASQKSSAPSASSGTGSSMEDDANISVMDKVKKLNKIHSESDFQQPRNSVQGNTQHPVRKNSKYQGDDDDTHITLGPEEKEWMVICSATEYHDMNRLLSKNPTLAKLKDFTNTALHWAAKSGKAEIIKLIANKPGVNIDQRSGYTALHLAAIHGHEHIIELLVQTFKADANLRDYSGKKAKQYLKNSASSKAQQLLQSRRLGSSDIHLHKSLDDSFVRSSTRMSSRAKEMSSLLQAKNVVARQPMLRSSWAGSMEELYEEEGVSSKSNHLSPSSARRKKSTRDGDLMPPPANPVLSRWNRYSDRSKSSSRESLNSPRNGRRNEDHAVKIIPRSESDPSMLEGTIV